MILARSRLNWQIHFIDRLILFSHETPGRRFSANGGQQHSGRRGERISRRIILRKEQSVQYGEVKKL